jgi:cell wall-associated NlpC family hydrolase
MSSIRNRGRHRKPRQSRTSSLIRGGVITGVVGTVAVAGTAGSALADEKPTERTGELPTLDGVLADSVATAAAATESYASETTLDRATEHAQNQAIAEAQQAAAERRAAEEAAREAAAREAEEREAARRAAEAEAQAQEEAEAAAAAEAQTTSAAEPAGGSGAGLATGSAATVLDFVRAQLGDAYSMGSSGPDAWDCSGLVQAAYASAGVPLPRVSSAQSTAGTQVSLDALQPGDILYWGAAGSAYHVAIYAGDGTFIGAQNPSTGVAQRDLAWDPPTGAVRVL